MMPMVYIILPVHNRRAITEKFIDCLVTQTYGAYHLILVDDGSTDGTEQMVKAKVGRLTVIKGSGDWWWAGSLQQGIGWLKQEGVADSDIVAFMNDDVLFEPDFLKMAVSLLDQHEGMLLPQVYNQGSGCIEESGVHADMKRLSFRTATSPQQINCLPTRGLFMRMSVLRRVGDFYPKWLPHYWSDYEYTLRAGRLGVMLRTTPKLLFKINDDATGYRSFEGISFFDFLKKYFSKRSVLNPIYSSSFIILASSKAYMPLSLIKVWSKAIMYILRQLKRSIKMWLDNRRSLSAIRRSRNDLKIIIGSASTRQSGWVSTNYPLLDLTNETTFSGLFEPNTVNNFLAEHVWEHLSLEDGVTACQNCFTYLKRGGVLRIAVPDGYHPDPDYIAQVKPGGYGPGADDHKALYNYQTLSATLERAGFKVSLLEWFDERGQFNFVDWSDQNGFISRSSRFDERNQKTPLKYTSLIVDATKI